MSGFYATRVYYNGTESMLNPYLQRLIARDSVVS